MLYPKLKFLSHPKNRPLFYTNFVQTVDGKVQVLKNTKDYWPIGSKTDHDVLIELRSYADCLVHGKNLAAEFGSITLDSLNSQKFIKMRIKNNKKPILPYFIIAKDTKKVIHLKIDTFIVSSNLKSLSDDLYKRGYRNVLVEGGPTLLASFLKENLLDEIFLTISPKIYGNVKNRTLTLVEGYLFPKKSIKHLTLLSVKKLKSELYLRYKVN